MHSKLMQDQSETETEDTETEYVREKSRIETE